MDKLIREPIYTPTAIIEWMKANQVKQIEARDIKSGQIVQIVLNFAQQLCYLEGKSIKTISLESFYDLEIAIDFAELKPQNSEKIQMEEDKKRADLDRMDFLINGINGLINELTRSRSRIIPDICPPIKASAKIGPEKYETHFPNPAKGSYGTLTEYIDAYFDNIAVSIADRTDELVKQNIKKGRVITKGMVRDKGNIRERLAAMLIAKGYSFAYKDPAGAYDFARLEAWLDIEDKR